MSKKQELVKLVLDRLERAGVDCGEMELYAEEGFWNKHPNGYCFSPLEQSVEAKLSCLTGRNLVSITEDDGITMGASLADLWSEWGRKGYFKADPEIITFDSIPMLRLRHDSYLSCGGSFVFKNSKDAYSGSNNGSSKAMNIDFITAPSGVDEDEWNKEWALFRRAMYISYPIEALLGRNTLFSLLDHNPQYFDAFVNRVDSEYTRAGIDGSLTWRQMLKDVEVTDNSWLTDSSLFIASGESNAEDGFSVFATLSFGRANVSLYFSDGRGSHQFTVRIPAWMPRSSGVREDYYFYTCWYRLSVTLLTMAHIRCSRNSCAPESDSGIKVGKVFGVSTRNIACNGLVDIGEFCFSMVEDHCVDVE